MDQLATLKPWAFVALAFFLFMWGFKRFVKIESPLYEGVMAILAGVAGVLMLLPG